MEQGGWEGGGDAGGHANGGDDGSKTSVQDSSNSSLLNPQQGDNVSAAQDMTHAAYVAGAQNDAHMNGADTTHSHASIIGAHTNAAHISPQSPGVAGEGDSDESKGGTEASGDGAAKVCRELLLCDEAIEVLLQKSLVRRIFHYVLMIVKYRIIIIVHYVVTVGIVVRI